VPPARTATPATALAEPAGRSTDLVCLEAGRVPYREAWDWQRRLHARRVAAEIPDTVLLLEHPPVYTAGRRTEAWERPTDGTEVIDVDRGGRITWHGPGQLVGYPIRALPPLAGAPADGGRAGMVDVVALIRCCAALGVAGQRVAGRSGVWVTGDGPDRKIAAIGVRVARGVSYHGFALNCDADLSAFRRIIPCGITDADVTSLSREAGRRVTVADLLAPVGDALAEAFGARLVRRAAAAEPVTAGG
jgi:lipoyl(octanoyl) transferase